MTRSRDSSLARRSPRARGADDRETACAQAACAGTISPSGSAQPHSRPPTRPRSQPPPDLRAEAPSDPAAAPWGAASAQADLSSSEALIAHLKLAIEKLRRELYGTRSEREDHRMRGNEIGWKR